MTDAPGGAARITVRPGGPAGPLAGFELAIFDKDGTLIEFHRMWSDWVGGLSDGLAAALDGRRLDDAVYQTMGIDRATGRVDPRGALAATPMTRIRDSLVAAVAASGVERALARQAVAAAWHSPDPVLLAREITDLRRLFGALRAAGTRIAVATSDDREPTERTLAHLGVAGLVDRVACADDGRPVKPRPDAVAWICRELGIPPERSAVIGDSPADLRMGRNAGAGLIVGVLTGVGNEESLGGMADLVVGSVEELRPLG